MKSIGTILAAPLACLGILGGIVAEQKTHIEPRDAEPYHARAKAALDGIPSVPGVWTTTEKKLPDAAVKLLRPNATFCRTFQLRKAGEQQWWQRYPVDVLIVQCRDSRDMVGHYPESCYPQSGWATVAKRQRTWQVGDLVIPGTEYQFERFTRSHNDPARSELAHSELAVVYNFLIVPGRGIVPDIEGVNRAAEDYQRRYFGAAQVQIYMANELASASERQRDELFYSLMKELVGPVKVLLSAEVDKKTQVSLVTGH
jgi:hypothetical protein